MFLLVLAACGDADTLVTGARVEEKRPWANSGRPELLSDDLVFTLTDLPTQGEVSKVPWAGSYWPTHKDSINYRWDGKDSQTAVEKFGQAFGISNLDDTVSEGFGVDSINGTTCSTDADCDKAKSESCSIREGETEGTCIETWFGICHAWAPIAIMEEEPATEVTYNGVTFKVNDLKALATMQYDTGLDNKSLSLRCDDKGDDLALDAYGNPTKAGCNDTNPGAFHVVITNFLGLLDQSLVEDRTYDYEVWNQPLRAFEVLSMTTVSAQKANELAGDTTGATDYIWNADAVSFKHVKLRLDYIGESDSHTDGHLGADIDTYTHSDTYTYILELDGSGDIVGGKWTGASKKAHPDFLWLPTLKTESTVAGMKWSDVDALLMKAQDTGTGFDWGEGCEDGSGSFEQAIAKSASVTIGTLPASKANVRVDLTSDQDVDLVLLDAAGNEVVAWPNGTLNGESQACTTHDGVKVCYSGYNGDGTNYGHEWLTLDGTLGQDFTLKAYGYAAGTAKVAYSFEAPADCVDQGEGSFQQAIVKGDTVAVGILPAGKQNLSITLESTADVDIQLVDGSTELVAWPNGKLNGPTSASITYENATFTYSGYEGVSGKPGHETLTVSGTLESDLILKAYGYKAGEATITYSWGK